MTRSYRRELVPYTARYPSLLTALPDGKFSKHIPFDWPGLQPQ
jgi:hypothetical protein